MTQEEKDRIDATYRNKPRSNTEAGAVVEAVLDVGVGLGVVTIGLFKWILVFPLTLTLLALALSGMGPLGFILALIISIYILK